MIFLFNRRAYGRVSVVAGTFILTNFWCFNFLPLIPHETHLVLSRAPTGECTSVPIPANAASIAAGYARPWGVVITAASLFAIAAADTALERGQALAVFVLGAAVCAIAWLVVGRVSADERARRILYGGITGTPVDPAWLPDETRHALGARLREELATRAPALARATYREAPDTAWEQVATDPDVTDAEFLQRALVLARIEWRDADRAKRARLEQAGDEAWRKWRAGGAPRREAPLV
jgi:hypothetical protein